MFAKGLPQALWPELFNKPYLKACFPATYSTRRSWAG